jgi:hypothetical protein
MALFGVARALSRSFVRFGLHGARLFFSLCWLGARTACFFWRPV